MEFIHVRNIERFHPGYKDRELLWAKIGICMAEGDPEFEMIEDETDKWRFICFILLELRAKKPLPLSEKYFKRKGFDLKKRSISLTVKMLHDFIDVVTEENLLTPVEENREEKNREEGEGDQSQSLKEPSIKFLDFVVMTQGQHDQLANKLGITVLAQYVERLNNYIGSKGKRYKSHYHTILNWHSRDGGTKPSESKSVDNRDAWERNANKSCANCRGTGAVYAPGTGKYSKCGCVRSISK